MWRQHQDLVGQLPHLARIPLVLCAVSEMHMGDICAWSSPADPHQLQSAFRPGGPRVQVSCTAHSERISLDVRKKKKRIHPCRLFKRKNNFRFFQFSKSGWMTEWNYKIIITIINLLGFFCFFLGLNLWNRAMIRLFMFDTHKHMRSLAWVRVGVELGLSLMHCTGNYAI